MADATLAGPLESSGDCAGAADTCDGFRWIAHLQRGHRVSHLRLAADRAEVVPAITKHAFALDVALVANSTGADVEGPKENYEACKYDLQARVADTDVPPDVRTGVNTLSNRNRALLDKVASNSIGLRDRVTAYAPILLTAENAVNGSMRVDSEKIRAEVEGSAAPSGHVAKC
jgi:hypothetical protein